MKQDAVVNLAARFVFLFLCCFLFPPLFVSLFVFQFVCCFLLPRLFVGGIVIQDLT